MNQKIFQSLIKYSNKYVTVLDVVNTALVFISVTSGRVAVASCSSSIGESRINWLYNCIYHFIFTLGYGFLKLFISVMNV